MQDSDSPLNTAFIAEDDTDLFADLPCPVGLQRQKSGPQEGMRMLWLIVYSVVQNNKDNYIVDVDEIEETIKYIKRQRVFRRLHEVYNLPKRERAGPSTNLWECPTFPVNRIHLFS